jgi:CDP-glucose 4,6-dehydratase
VIGDVRDLEKVRAAMQEAAPEVVFHLAAQALVLPSYEAPVDTLATNVVGTANVLEAIRECPEVRAVVVITSDKVYENREWVWGYREDDRLGGKDPYSCSKACAELVTACYRHSFFARTTTALATARAGNVVGGGDWARHRIVPDFVRAMLEGRPLKVRNPASTRPWQHVLDPLAGYLLLAEGLTRAPAASQGAWNFGPPADAVQPVARLADLLTRCWGHGSRWEHEALDQPHEAGLLTLDATKAGRQLGWRPRLAFEQTAQWTIDWYRACADHQDMAAFTEGQIDRYLEIRS